MGCCTSTIASRAAIPGPGAAAPQQAAPPAAEATEAREVMEVTEVPQVAEGPVLVELSERERAIGWLKSIFEEVSANEHGQADKAELTASLENQRDLDALMKKSCMNALADVTSTLIKHRFEFVTWDDFLTLAEVVGHDLKEIAEVEVTHEVEELEEAVVAEVATAEETKDKVLAWFKGVFEGFTRDEDGAVSKEQLEAKLKEDNRLDGESIGVLIGHGGFNPLWSALSALDTNKDGSISWEEFRAHVLGQARQEEKMEQKIEIVIEGDGDEEKMEEKMESMIEGDLVTERCWGCC